MINPFFFQTFEIEKTANNDRLVDPECHHKKRRKKKKVKKLFRRKFKMTF